jgi:hypothetical protein
VQPQLAAQTEQPLRAEEPVQRWLLLLGLAEALQRDVRPLDLPAEPKRWLDAALRALQPALEDEPPRDPQAASQQSPEPVAEAQSRSAVPVAAEAQQCVAEPEAQPWARQQVRSQLALPQVLPKQQPAQVARRPWQRQAV